MIEPALTPDEWARKTHYPADLNPATGDLRISAEDGVVAIEEADRHALAALALYGQPFGFTREDVKLLRAAAETCRNDDHCIASELDLGEWFEGRAEELAQRYEAFADRIESLLPPEKE